MDRMRGLAIGCVVAAAALAAAPARADDVWAGKRVMTRKSGAKLRDKDDGGRDVERRRPGRNVLCSGGRKGEFRQAPPARRRRLDRQGPAGADRGRRRFLHRPHPSERQGRQGVGQPRLGLERAGRAGHRRQGLQRGRSSESEVGRLARRSGPHLVGQEGLDKAIDDFNGALRIDPQNARRLEQPGQRPLRAAGLRQGDRRFRQGREARPQVRCRRSSAAATPTTARRSTTRRSTTTARPSGSTRTTPWRSTTGATPGPRGDQDKAIADYNETLRLDPSYVAAHVNRGSAWRKKGDLEKAIADFTDAVRLDPKNVAAFRDRASAWRAKQDYDKAIADCDEAIRLDPNDAPTFRDRALAWSAKREYAKALADYQEAVRLSPDSADGLNGMAWLLATSPDEKLRDGKKAVEAARHACELGRGRSRDTSTRWPRRTPRRATSTRR